MPVAEAIPPQVLDQAISWLVRLHSGTASAQEHAGCLHWRQAAVVNERAWQALQATEVQFQQLAQAPTALVQGALAEAGPSRRSALKALGLGALALGTGFGGWRLAAEQGLGADYSTATGERRSVRLADGSRLQLNTSSAVNVRFGSQQRQVQLLHGELFLDSRGQFEQVVPLWASSRHGRLQAFAAAFSLRDEGSYSRLRVESGTVSLALAAGNQPLEAGQEVTFASGRCEAAVGTPMNASAWVHGQLVVRRLPLQALARELERYRPGWVSCAAAIAQWPVSGVFQLGNIDQALGALADTLPVRVERPLPWWVRLVPA